MTTLLLILTLVFVLANGFFVAAEFAIVKVRSTQLAELAASGSATARMARRLTSRVDAYLSATQLGVTLVSLALGWIGEPTLEKLIEPFFARQGIWGPSIAHSIAATVAFIAISVLHIIFGELAPKRLAIKRALGTSLVTAYPLHFFYVITFPFVYVLNAIANRLLAAMGIGKADEHEMVHSPEELRMILSNSEKAGVLSQPNREMIEGVFQFSRRTARHIMVPRTDVVILSTEKSIEENLEIIRNTRHTRYPLCNGNLDDTIGLIHVKDLFLAQLRGPGRRLNDLKREVLFVPENTTVDHVLEQFLESKTHMAIVLDEYGGASGIISMENITEELFGQIQDEFDRERPEVEPLSDGRYRVRGDYLIEDLADRLKVDVGDPAEETVGGYVVAQIGREVHPGDKVELGELQVRVIEGERYRVRWVMVARKKPELVEPAAKET